MKIAITNYKGGVAKSQTTHEFAWWLAMHGRNVLVIDTDPQANITDLLLRGNKPHGRTLPDILTSGSQLSPDDVNTCDIGNGKSIDFIVSNIELGRIEGRIISKLPKEYIIGDTIASIAENYDFVLFDTAPSAELLGISTLLAVDGVIIPSSLDMLSVSGTERMIGMIRDVKSEPRLNPNIELLGILVTRYRKTISTLFHGNAIKDKYAEHLIPTYIRESTKVQQASNLRKTIQEYDPSCTSAKDYESAFSELIQKF